MKKLPPFVKKPRFLLGLMWRFVKSIRMTFLDNPTKKWKRDFSRELVVDLEKGTLVGIGLGEPVENLAFLGPCEDFNCMSMECVDCDGNFLSDGPEEAHVIQYGSLGLSIHFGLDAKIDFFSLTFIPDETEPSTQPYSGLIQYAGSTVTASEFCDAEGVIEILGEPKQDTDLAGMGVTKSEENPYGNPSSRELVYERESSVCLVCLDENDQTTSLLVMTASESKSC